MSLSSSNSGAEFARRRRADVSSARLTMNSQIAFVSSYVRERLRRSGKGNRSAPLFWKRVPSVGAQFAGPGHVGGQSSLVKIQLPHLPPNLQLTGGKSFE